VRLARAASGTVERGEPIMRSLTKALLLAASMLTLAARLASAQATVVFVDGTRMEVQSYEVKASLVLLKTKEGKLMSVPRSYVNLVATEQLNRAAREGAQAPSPRPRDPQALVSERVEPEPPVRAPEPTPPPAAPVPAAPPAPSPKPPVSPPPVWSNAELQVSLVVPSASWTIEDMPPSFDVAASLANASTEAKATLALIRQKLRGSGDFKNVVRDIERSISQAPGFRSIANGPLDLDPYIAHEFGFVKAAGFVPVFNRLVVVYSRDLAYVLSLTCPETRIQENEADFEALVRGLVVKKSRKDLSF
jgi:hypothetical protein